MAKLKPAPVVEAVPPEGYTVLARRYRPQQFDDLVGQEPVARALRNALSSNRVAHAYLFTGARGVGKTSTVRILAKALNCVKGPTPTPCDQCDNCRTIATGEDVDVLEIDGASNRGIDEVRELRNNVQYRPSRSRYKIYIIDEVHMLTPPAFNALLKTLEEPPAHVKFIFATTEVQKIPVTILSRCQRFDFAGIGTSRIVERLQQIVQRENMAADDDALELVARRAGGSMRDAQSLLDQLLAFGSDRLTAEQVHQLLGTAQDDRVADLAAAALAEDPKRALELLGQAAEQGAQLGELLDQLLAYWRDLMVLNCAGSAEGLDVSIPPRLRETVARQATTLKLDTILAGLDILAATKARLRGSNHGRTLLEMALVRLGRLDDLVSVAQLTQWLAQGRPGGDQPAAPTVSPTPRPRLSAGVQAVEPPEQVKKKSLTAPEAPVKPAPLPLTQQFLAQIWQELLAQIGPMMSTELQKAEFPAISGPNTLVIRFPAEYNLLSQKPAGQARIEEALRKITGQPCQVRVVTASGVPIQGQLKSAEATATTSSRYRRQRAEAVQGPLLKRAMEVLGAQVVHVDDGFGAAPVTAVERVEADDEEP